MIESYLLGVCLVSVRWESELAQYGVDVQKKKKMERSCVSIYRNTIWGFISKPNHLYKLDVMEPTIRQVNRLDIYSHC